MESWCDVWLYSPRVLLWNVFCFFHTDNFPFLGILVKLAAHWVGFLFPPSLPQLFIQMTGLQMKDFVIHSIYFDYCQTKSFLSDDILHMVLHWSPLSTSSTCWPNLIHLPEHFRDFQIEKCYQSYCTFYRWETKSKYGYTLTEKSFLPPSNPSHEHCGSADCSMPRNVPVILLRCSLNDFL